MSTEPSQSIGTGENLFELEEDVTQSSLRKRRLTSKVWNDFERKKELNGYIATCKHCKKDFVADSNKGTSHLKSHLAKHCPVLQAKGTNTSKGTTDSTPKATNFVFDQESSRMDLARMVIKHNYPFNMAEHEFFEIFLNGLQPMFKLPSRNTIRADVLCVYQIEKAKLYKLLDDLSCRITLTTDIWTSDHQNLAYACLTAHYITDDWKLKKKILSYKCIVYPHEYKSEPNDSTSSSILESDSSSSSPLLHGSSKQGSLARFHKWYAQAHASSFYVNQKTEVEIYLEEAVFPIQDNFNILHWWKVNSAKFPTLAKLARDILAVPATTVASEAAFSIGGRVIDETRACLLPEIVEALVTTNDWIESHKKRYDECEDEQ